MKVSSRYQAVGPEESRARADELCAWLREYVAHRVNSRLMDERRSIPPHVALDLGNRGFFGVQVEERYGGLALRNLDVARVLEQASALDLSLGTWILVCLFPGVRPIAAFATPELKDAALRDLAQGRILAGYAQTEPGAGTHFSAMAARAEWLGDDRWRLSGDKIWIGNGTWATYLNLMAQEWEGDQRHGLSAFAVPTDRPGFRPGRELLSMGMRAMVQSEVGFRAVEVDAAHLLGTRGEGLQVGIDSMSFSRFAIAATCIGAMRRCVRDMHRFGARRSIATGRLLDHPTVLTAIGEAGARVSAAESVLYRTAELLDSGADVPMELFAVSKVAASEFLWRTADRLVQVLGSRGYDEANHAPQLLRDARVTRIFEGTTEALVAYLGGRALNPRGGFRGQVLDPLGADDLADALEEVGRTVRAREALAAQGPGADGLERTWQVALVGRAAVWAVVAGAVRARAQADSGVSSRSVDWALHCFRRACRQAGEVSAPEVAAVSSAEADDLVAEYVAMMGDLDQTCPGERRELDPLLRREPPTTPA